MNADRDFDSGRSHGLGGSSRALTGNRAHWIVDHLPDGRIIDFACAEGTVAFLAAERGSVVTALDTDEAAVVRAKERQAELAGEVAGRVSFQHWDTRDLKDVDAGLFDAVVVTELLERAPDPVGVMREAFRVTKPGARLIAVVPYGLGGNSDRTRVFYRANLHSLIDPLFGITDMSVLDGCITVTAIRREHPAAEAPSFALNPEESTFLRREREFTAEIQDLRERLRHVTESPGDMAARPGDLEQDRLRAREIEADLRLRLTAQDRKIDALQAALREERRAVRLQNKQLERSRAGEAAAQEEIEDLKRHVTQMSEQIDRVKASRAWKLISKYRRILRRKTPYAELRASELAALPAAGESDEVSGPISGEEFNARFAAWLEAARNAAGDEVVVMFSGTTFVQEHRGNRPIRLTNVYLSRNCPVFFNYYRWDTDQPLPEHPDPLLFQSPIDLTPDLLFELLRADFGDKRKIFFASFPHELMVRNLVLAAQDGWVTVYDVRDDWEEFAKVGMATWYHQPYERYVASHADFVTAVSRPLARKISAMAQERDVHVVPNALDTDFPRTTGLDAPEKARTVGYFGHLTDKWFDWKLVIEAARRYPEYKFELAGHQAPEIDLPENIHMLGLLSHAEIAERSRGWGLALIPFINGPLADSVDPIKVYEYLHLGLPVLTTYFPQCTGYPGVTVTESSEEFLSVLPELIGSPVNTAGLDRWLEKNTWDDRVDEFSRLSSGVAEDGRENVMALLGRER